MAFTVHNALTGSRFAADPKEAILDAALRQGITIAYSCRNGACASCKGRVVSGVVHYPNGKPPGLDATAQASGGALFCQARARSDLVIEVPEIEAVKDIPIAQYPTRVIEKTRLAEDVMRLRLKLPAAKRMLFLAGQYVDIIQPGGVRRAFSIASPSYQDHELELHLRHVPGGDFTGFVFDQLSVGAILRVEGPKGTFFIRHDSDRPILMMAGGTGFAPVKGMVEQMLFDGLERPVHLYWGAGCKRELYARELTAQWVDTHDMIRFTPVLSQPRSGDDWHGRTGLVHQALLNDHSELNRFDVYMSGPPPMIDAARRAFLNQGLPEPRLFYDSFDFAADVQLKIARKHRKQESP